MFFQIKYGTGFSNLETEVTFIELADEAAAENLAEELASGLVDEHMYNNYGIYTKDTGYDNMWYEIKEITREEFNQAMDDFGGDYHRT